MNSYDIAEIGLYVSNWLHRFHLSRESELVIPLSEDVFRKIDEDLYYRQNPDGTDFVPSEDEIAINFENCSIKFVKEWEKEKNIK